MNASEQSRFDILYQRHLVALNLQGKARKTIEAYAFAVRRLARYVDRCPDDLTTDELRDYFAALIDSHSWSAVKIDRNGIRFFYEHVLGAPIPWIDMVKPPVIQSLPDVLASDEIARIIRRTQVSRYQTFWLVVYSMGLRLGEALKLTVADIDSTRMLVHVRQGKGNKDRFVKVGCRIGRTEQANAQTADLMPRRIPTPTLFSTLSFAICFFDKVECYEPNVIEW